MPTENQATIRLDQFLKSQGLVATGGQAKRLIQEGEVRVNNEIETRRRRQLRQGDLVQLGDEQTEVAAGDIDDASDAAER